MILELYLRLCCGSRIILFTPMPSMNNFVPLISKSLPPTHISVLSPSAYWASTSGYLSHTWGSQVKSWTCYLPFLPPHLPISQTYFSGFLILVNVTTVPDGKIYHPEHLHLSHLLPTLHYQVLSPNISSFGPVIYSTATTPAQATYIFHLDHCSIPSRDPQAATPTPLLSPCYTS